MSGMATPYLAAVLLAAAVLAVLASIPVAA